MSHQHSPKAGSTLPGQTVAKFDAPCTCDDNVIAGDVIVNSEEAGWVHASCAPTNEVISFVRGPECPSCGLQTPLSSATGVCRDCDEECDMDAL